VDLELFAVFGLKTLNGDSKLTRE